MNPDKRSSQSRFLTRCAFSELTLNEVLDELQINPTTLARWLGQRSFRQRVNRLRRSLALSRDLTLTIGAVRAAQVLATSTQDSTNCNHRACVDLIRLSRDAKARRRAEDRPSRRTIKSAMDQLPVHPELDRNEAQKLIDELK